MKNTVKIFGAICAFLLLNLLYGFAQPLTLTYPNGGETLHANSSVSITWQTTGATISQVNLAYSTNNSTSWTTIATAISNTGSYNWTIPNVYSTQCLVRVSSSGNISVNDVSNAPFTMTNFDVIVSIQSSLVSGNQVSFDVYAKSNISTAINLSESSFWLTYNASRFTSPSLSFANSITYSSSTAIPVSGIIAVDIFAPDPQTTSNSVQLSTTGNGTKIGRITLSGITNFSSTANFQWYTAGVVLYCYTPSTSPSFTLLNTYFTPPPTISLAPNIVVNSPNGGETLRGLSTTTITWTSAGVGSQINVSLSTDGGASWSSIAAVSSTSNSVQWAVPSINSSQALIKISDATNASIYDQSDGIFTILPLYMKTRIKIFLQGAYQTDGTMQLSLWNYLPITDPYANFVTVATIPANVTDWLRVEFRSTSNNTQIITSAVCFLKNDGTVLDLDGSEGVQVLYDNLPSGNYYLVVQHRNHLKIMSAQPVTLATDSPTYDFTTAQSQAYSTSQDGMNNIAIGVYAMVAGDVVNDGILNATDRATIRNSTGQIGYLNSDINLDSLVNAVDRVLERNNGIRLSQVP